MNESERTLAFGKWIDALDALTGSPDLLRAWQDQRFGFAYRIGEVLTGASGTRPSMLGPAVYGVFVRGAGLAYVGQTLDARRRLRDLAVGESHHLANTVPPEVWERVVVVEWPRLLCQVNAEERSAAAELGDEVCGLSVEHSLQSVLRPPLNARRRTSTGEWRDRNLADSRSRGAEHAAALPMLCEQVRLEWQTLTAIACPNDRSTPVVFTSAGRVTFPRSLRDRALAPDRPS